MLFYDSLIAFILQQNCYHRKCSPSSQTAKVFLRRQGKFFRLLCISFEVSARATWMIVFCFTTLLSTLVWPSLGSWTEVRTWYESLLVRKETVVLVETTESVLDWLKISAPTTIVEVEGRITPAFASLHKTYMEHGLFPHELTESVAFSFGQGGNHGRKVEIINNH